MSSVIRVGVREAGHAMVTGSRWVLGAGVLGGNFVAAVAGGDGRPPKWCADSCVRGRLQSWAGRSPASRGSRRLESCPESISKCSTHAAGLTPRIPSKHMSDACASQLAALADIRSATAGSPWDRANDSCSFCEWLGKFVHVQSRPCASQASWRSAASSASGTTLDMARIPLSSKKGRWDSGAVLGASGGSSLVVTTSWSEVTHNTTAERKWMTYGI